jgi:serine/threonine protein kinase
MADSPPVSEGPTRVSDPARIGPYSIDQKIGAGGMGTVYLGRHVETGKLAAVKVLPASLAREEGFVERFNREIDAMRRLDNAHTVKLFESGLDGETYFYAMEYVPGETLMGLLRRERKLAWPRAVEITIEICQALKAAHDCGIIHRDLKPSNLLLTQDGHVKLTDFGVAQVFAANRLTVTGGIIGTAEFMSPEQAQGKRATKQSDLYSLGAVLYCMVTGRPPFSGSTAVDIIQKHKFGQFDRARTYVPDLPYWLDEIITQLLDKDPAKRFPDAYVLARKLDSHAHRVIHSPGNTSVDGDAPTFLTEGDASQTRVDSGSIGGPGVGPATLARDLVREHFAEKPASWVHDLFEHTGFLVSLLAVVVGLIVWFSWPRRPDPEMLWRRADELLSQPPGPGWIAARDEYLSPLRALGTADWAQRVDPLWQRVALYEASTRKGLKRRLTASDQSTGEPMRLIQQALNLQAIGEYEAAEKQLTAMADLLGGDPESDDLEALVRTLAAQVSDERQGQSARRAEWAQTQLERAENLAKAGQEQDARRVWQAFLALYETESSLASEVAAVRKRLAKP